MERADIFLMKVGCLAVWNSWLVGLGNWAWHFSFFPATTPPPEKIEPCNPSPCGINAQCTDRGQAASCSCIRDYTGNPYVECKPECTVNSECPNVKACINNRCGDPCPGVCGAHATCYVSNHAPMCRCDAGYTGDAFVSCRLITTCKCALYR